MKDFITKEIKDLKEGLKFHKSIMYCFQDKEHILKLTARIYAYESILRFINKEEVSLSEQLKQSLFSRIKIRLKVKIKLKLKSWYEQITIKY